MRSRQRLLLGVVVFGTALAYAWWIAGDRFSLGTDEGIYMEGGRRVAAGEVPYRDFFVLTGPLTFWIEGALARWGGVNIALLRFPLILDVAVLTWAVYWLATQFEGEWFSAGLAVVFLATNFKLNLLVIKHRWDSAALATLAVVTALAAGRRESRLMWMLSGALIAAAAWTTPSAALVAAPLLIWSARRRLAGALMFLAGTAIVTAAAGGYLAGQRALGPMLEAMRWTAANYRVANTLTYGSIQFRPDVAVPAGFDVLGWMSLILGTVYASFPAVLPLAALVGWGWWILRCKDRDQKFEIVMLLAATLGLVLSAWPRWSSLQLVFVMAIPFTLCGILLNRSLGPRWRDGVRAAILAVSIGALIWKLVAASGAGSFATRAGVVRGTMEDVEFMEPLERRIHPGDTLFVFPYLPTLYPLLDAHNPTRYSFLQPGMMTAEDECRAVADLEKGNPKWVVMGNLSQQAILTIWPGSDPSRIPMEAMHGYIRAHYRDVEQVRGKWGVLEIMQRMATIR